jgi:hypothetical protein
MKITSILPFTFLLVNFGFGGQPLARAQQAVSDSQSNADSKGGGEPVDLTRYYQTPATSFARIPKYPWRDVPRGSQTFSNVSLSIGGMICLWGGANAKGGLIFAEAVNGIEVSRKFDSLYLYHASFAVPPENTRIAQLVFRYDDGTSFTNSIRYGKHVRDWFQGRNDPEWLSDPKSQMVWRGTNSMSQSTPPTLLRFFITEFPNPKPSIRVAAVDLVSSKSKTAPCNLAMTTGPGGLMEGKAVRFDGSK